MTINFSPSIASNISAFNQTQNQIEQNQNQLSSGQRITNASVDPSGLQVLIDLQSQILGNNTAIRNNLDGISAIQIAEGGLSQVNDSLQRVRELSVQAQNGILNDQDRAALQSEADALIEGIGDTLGQATFNNQSLLSEDGSLQLQVGGDIGDTQDVGTFDVSSQLEDLGLFSLDISSSDALDTLDQSLEFVGSVAGEFGAAENRLNSSINFLSESSVNEAAAASRIGDTDFAKTVSEQTNALLRQEVATSIEAQANARRGLVLNLLGTGNP